MAEIETLARPYADAVFDLARANDALTEWSNALAALAAIVANDDVAALMGNPAIADDRLAQAIIDVGKSDLNAGAVNLVRLLVENSRLALAPAIATQFEALRCAAEARVDVSVVSAVALSEQQQKALAKSLEKRLACSVRLSFDEDEAVIGGVIVRAGDLVIDASLRAQLERMRRSVAG